jgi:RNA polymerase sigma factor (sigma-70 family)
MVGDEAELYRSLAPRLEQIVRGQVRAPREVIEDACHDAWTKLINHGERVHRETALAWLARTAIREAWHLDRRERRELSLEAEAEFGRALDAPARLPGPAERVEHRERLSELHRLPERQQRLVWLRAAGLSYVEMAAYTGDTVRTVERQVLRATARMHEAQRQADAARSPSAATMTAGPLRTSNARRSEAERGLQR